MKKTLYLLLIIAMLFSFVACQKEIPVEYTVYYSSVDGIDDSIIEKDLSEKANNLTFKNVNELDFMGSGESYVDSDAKAEIEIKLGEKVIKGQYLCSGKYEEANSKDKAIHKLNTYHAYAVYDENGVTPEIFNIRKETGELIKYINTNDNNLKGDCTADEAKKIADELILSLYDKKYTDEYSYEGTKLNSGTDGNPKNYYTVKYTRYLYGYEVDAISVHVNKVGQIVGVFASDIGKCYKLEERISEKALQQAHDALMDVMGMKDQKMSADTIVLQIARDGKLYMQSLLKPQKLSTFFTINVE